MTQTTVVLALTAGMLAAVNPCGFALLPAYLSLLVAGESTGDSVRRALASTAAMTSGFVAVFGAFGLAVAPVAGWIQQRLPWLTVGLGVLLVAVGAWLAAGRTLPAPWRGPRAPELRRTLPSMFVFGAAYAAASLSCTIGPFLAIVVASMRAGSTGAGVGLFLAYAAGMGLAVGAAALAVGLLRTSLLRAVRRAGAAISRLGGVLLLLAGGYVAYYGWYEIRLSTGRSTVDDPVVAAGGQIQHSISSALGAAGVEVVAGVFTVLLAAALVTRRLTRGPDARGSEARGPEARGSDARGPEARGSDARGSDARGSEVREEVGDLAGKERPQLRAGVRGHGTEPA